MADGIVFPAPQQATAEERRIVTKTKTLGRSGEVRDDAFRQKLETQKRNLKQDQERQESNEQADKHRDAIFAKVGARRHLQYEVIEEAAIVQVTVVNSEDGTIVRKFPPDTVVSFAKKFAAQRRTSGKRLDVTF